jgi:isoquinoline 1-oxidoreductase beta subunit
VTGAVESLSRRALLAGAGTLVVFGLGGCSLIPPIPKRPEPTLADALGWMRVEADGRIGLWCPRVEMGQGVQAALQAIVADALGIDRLRIVVHAPGTADIGLVKATVGSDSIRELRPLLQEACTTLRAALPAATIAARPVAAAHPDPALLAIVTGAQRYTADHRVPGLRHACVLHPPWRRELGPRLEHVDEAALRALPGFVALLHLPALDGPAIVADHPGALVALRAAAQARWQAPPQAADPATLIDVDAALGAGRITKDSGSVHAAGPWSVDLRLDVPAAAHAAIEPRCALARFDADGALDVWCATQDPFYVRDVLARDQALPVERVRVHPQRLGGSFGGRTIATVEREAAFVARAIGAPVRLQWSREDEFQAGFHRPPSSHRVRVRVGPDGRITDWWHALSSSHVLFTNAAMPAWMQRITDLVGDDGTARGQHAPYAYVRARRSLTLTRLPIATGPWRGLGAGPNVLAIEAAMDAAARIAGQDPVDFRLRHLEGAAAGPHLQQPQRLADVLRRVAARARAAPPAAPVAPDVRIGRGVACGVYKGRSVAAAVAEVEVGADTIVVRRLWCSHDCGAIVDADGVRAQVEGNLVWSLGIVLSDELTAPQGRPAATNFGTYALPRLAQMPALDIDLVDSGAPSSGAGETAIVAGAGAIYNALVAASGRMPARLPVRPADLGP